MDDAPRRTLVGDDVMKVSLHPYFEFFTLEKKLVDGELIYDIIDLDEARGIFQLHFSSDCIIDYNSAILINTVELLDFLYRTSVTLVSECFLLDMAPRLFSQVRDKEVIFSWPDPTRVELEEEDVLEICSLEEFRQALTEAEAAATSLFAHVGSDLREYLWTLARGRKL